MEVNNRKREEVEELVARAAGLNVSHLVCCVVIQQKMMMQNICIWKTSGLDEASALSCCCWQQQPIERSVSMTFLISKKLVNLLPVSQWSASSPSRCLLPCQQIRVKPRLWHWWDSVMWGLVLTQLPIKQHKTTCHDKTSYTNKHTCAANKAVGLWTLLADLSPDDSAGLNCGGDLIFFFFFY